MKILYEVLVWCKNIGYELILYCFKNLAKEKLSNEIIIIGI